jgi:hypothetical protein
MTVIQSDINKYQGFLEFAQDGLFRCHANDEQKFQKLIFHYGKVLSAMEELKEALEEDPYYTNEHGVLIDKRGE